MRSLRISRVKFPQKHIIHSLFFSLLLLVIGSCKDEQSWGYKQWHNTLAHYNTYFNAEQKWLETYEMVRESYKEDFRKPIEIYNFGTTETLMGNQSSMDEVIKKASTMIDRHPKSKWVDDAFLLTGKAYFLKGDPNAAIDIFDYVFNQYNDPEIRFTARLWTVQGLLIKDKVIEAEAMAQSIVDNKELPKKLQWQAQLTLGAIYHKQKKYQQSAELMAKALPKVRNRMDRYRIYFALGQAYQKTNQIVLAEKCFSKVPLFNPPYEIAFNAQLARVELLTANQSNFNKANRILNDMLRDDKNIDYKGQIYYRIALNEIKSGKTDKGVQTLKLSVQNSTTDKAQKTTSYLKIGDVYFDKRNYQVAGLYYDSANRTLDDKHPDFETILAKNQVLGDLLEHLLRIKNNDSLIRMATDADWRQKKIREAKNAEKLAKEQLEKNQKNKSNNNPVMNMPGGMPNTGDMQMPGAGSGGGSFPFYNITLRKKGISEFNRIWGNRPNNDYWKYTSKVNSSENTNNNNPNENAGEKSKEATGEKSSIDSALLKNIPEDERKYYMDLPMSENSRLKMGSEIEESYMKSGEIYATRLNEEKPALEQFLTLLKRFPNSVYKPQAYYEIIKIYKYLKDDVNADKYKSNLQMQFPESIYIKMLDNPGLVVTSNSTDNKTNVLISNRYDSMVVFFQKGFYKKAMEVKLETDKSYSGNALQPRFDYVYALCLLKQNDNKCFDLLEQIIQDYPNTDVSEKSLAILQAKKRLSAPKAETTENTGVFALDKATTPLQCMIIVPKNSNVNMIKSAISDLNKKEFSFESIQMGPSIAADQKYLIFIENFASPDKSKFYAQFLRKQTSYFSGKGLFEYEVCTISDENMQLLVKSLNWNSYLNWYKEQNNL